MATSTLTRPTNQTPEIAEPAERVRAATRGFRLSFSEFGGTRKLSSGVLAKLAEEYNADARQISATKRLLDSTHPVVRLYREKKREVSKFFAAKTLSSPRPGVRLLLLHGLDEDSRNRETNDFLEHMNVLLEDYHRAVERLTEPNNWQSVVAQMSEKLGQLFVAEDYPSASQLQAMLTAEIMPEEIDLPTYYRQLAPNEYARAAAQVQARFQAVVDLQEAELVKGLQKLVNDFRERMVNYHDGEAVRFTNSVVTNVKGILDEFKDKCKMLGIGEGAIEEQLNKVVDLLTHDRYGNRLSFEGMAQELRDDPALARKLVVDMNSVSESLAGLATNAPRRTIIRRAQQAATADA